MNAKAALYSAVGEELTRYEIEVEKAALCKRETIKALANVQYAWPHPSRRYLYVATSNRSSGNKGDFNHISAFRIDPASGALTPHGESRALTTRAGHICVDPGGRYVLSAHNLPSGATVNPINSDGTIGPQVAQRATLECGCYPHQIMMMPSGRTVILVDRGNSATASRPEDPGALRLFAFRDGSLSQLSVIAPNGGYGFGPRHLDFHPTRPWVYVSLERQSMLYMYRIAGDVLEPVAAFVCDTLADREHIKPRQLAGAIHVHPNGGFVYLANRADWTVDDHGMRVFGGGENSIVVYSIDAETGEPELIQHADTHSIHVRTFALDPSGRLLVAASLKSPAVRQGATIAEMPVALSVFRIGSDGRLAFVRKYDIDAGSKLHWWMGIVALE